jgi:hypothetical protein
MIDDDAVDIVREAQVRISHRLAGVFINLIGVIAAVVAIGIALALVTGCRDDSPPPQRVPIPAQSGERERVTFSDPVKPMPPPPEREQEFQPPFDDVPIVSQRPPEQPAFVDAYRRVGSPRITLFVNRTLEGNIIPVNPSETAHPDLFGSRSNPAGETKSPAIYLHPGQYDEVSARALDYEAVENIMTDWLAANGQVTIISPSMARQRLSDQQVKELQEGRPTALSEVAQQLGADVLIQVQAHPTKQTSQGLEVRIIAEAMNTRGGASLGRAVVDVPPPLLKTTINRYTRFLARKLMDDMTQSWLAPAPPPAPPVPAPAPAPTTQP